MIIQPSDGSSRETQPLRSDPVAVIRAVPTRGVDNPARTTSLLVIAWAGSLVIHGLLLALFLLVTINVGTANVATETEVIQTLVDDEKKDANLTNDEEGLNPDQFLNYDLARIEDHSVPGPVNVAEAIGIKDAPQAPIVNVPPPAGLGGNEGQSGGLDALTPGLANPFGFAGGMRGLNVPGGFGGRSGATRQRLVEEGGGNSKSEAAVAAGLKWLVMHQAPDGHWSLDGFNQHGHCNCTGFGIHNDIAATAFGLLPLLAAGETHKNPKAIYGKHVHSALKYLMSKQARDGSFGGGMYAHGLASIAMCEAYGMTADPALRSSAQRALNYIRGAQSEGGGWRYEPRQGGDTSVTGWLLMALKSGQLAGLEVDDPKNPTFARAAKFLNSVSTSDGSGYGYLGPSPTPTMTAVGLLCRLYLGTGPRNSGIIGGIHYLKRTPPGSMNNSYYFYYATQVLHHVGGPDWEAWNPKMRDLLIARQDKGLDAKKLHQKGSWSPAGDAHGGAGGRLMVTSLSLLTLEVYYRHLPLYHRDLGGEKAMAGN
jgi:hypothetical protein